MVATDPFSSSGDEGGPSLEELEAQMQGEVASRAEPAATASPTVRRAVKANDDDEKNDGKATPLPELDSLVARLPAEARETLEELFRARFIAVKKVPKKLLQPATSKRRGGADEGVTP